MLHESLNPPRSFRSYHSGLRIDHWDKQIPTPVPPTLLQFSISSPLPLHGLGPARCASGLDGASYAHQIRCRLSASPAPGPNSSSDFGKTHQGWKRSVIPEGAERGLAFLNEAKPSLTRSMLCLDYLPASDSTSVPPVRLGGSGDRSEYE